MKKTLLRVSAALIACIITLAITVYTQLPEKIGETPELQTKLFKLPAEPFPKNDTYIYRSAGELAAMIKTGRATSVDVVTAHINRIKNHNSKYNAVVWLREDEALAEAAAADRKVASGDTAYPLLGVPVTVKEQFCVKGLPVTLNAKRIGITATKDAAAVQQIKRAGAIILGTTNLSFMVSFNETFGEVYPTGSNPYDTSRTPGGSTGGGAAALAAGFTPLSLGGDAGGSVRIPAAFCGVYGFKPSFGAVNITDGVMPFEIMQGDKFGIAHAGFMARTAADLQLYWQVLKRTPIDTRFQENIKWPEPQQHKLQKYRIAWMDEWPYAEKTARVGKDVTSKLNTLIDSLQKQQMSVTKDAPDTYGELLNVWAGMLFSITSQDESRLVRFITKKLLAKMDNGDPFFEEIALSLDDQSPARWSSLLERQQVITEKTETFFSEYDFLILPLTYGAAFPKCNACQFLADDDGNNMHYIDYFPYTGIFNASGHPAAVIPMGLNNNGMPIGLQIVAGMHRDDELLYFIKQIEPLITGFIGPRNIKTTSD